MTTLTREALLGKAKPTYQTVEVEGFGTVGIRSCPELQRSRRISALFDAQGNLKEGHKELRRVYMIIDQIMESEDKPMFTEADVAVLGKLDGAKLDALVAAINGLNEVDEKKDTAGSNDSSKN